MTIATVDDYIASVKQVVEYAKLTSVTAVSGAYYTLFNKSGQPGFGTLAAGNATVGVSFDDTITGSYPINAFAGGATGYLTRVSFNSSVICRLALFDCLYKVGEFAYNATPAVSASPSLTWQGRVPGSDYKGLELWMEVTTAFASGTVFTITVTYTNQDGTTGKSTGAFGLGGVANLTVNRCYQIPLASGDAGIQKIESLTINANTGYTAGAFNLMIMRPLVQMRVGVANAGDSLDFLKTGAPQIYDTSALYLLSAPDSTSTGFVEATIEVASK